jgi:polysaccharide pyruvyl transferase WcaK-like protein
MFRAKNTVLLINEGLSDNFGDQIIKESMLHLIHKLGFQSKFQDLTRNKTEYLHQYNIDAIVDVGPEKVDFFKAHKAVIWKLLWVVKNCKRVASTALYKYDAAVIGGGQLLLSNGIFPLALLVWVSLLRIRNSNKIVLFSVGMQGEYGKVQKMVLSYVFRHTHRIYVRDEVSQDILMNLFKTPSTLTIDSAFIYGQVHVPKQLVKQYTHLLGIVDYRVYLQYVNNTPLRQHEYYETWIASLGSDADIRSIALIYATPEDRAECLLFLAYVKENHHVDIELLENKTNRQFLHNLQLGETVVSGRMHSLILALVLRKNIIAYPISEKIRSFLQVLGDDYDVDRMEEQVLSDFTNMISEVTQ